MKWKYIVTVLKYNLQGFILYLSFFFSIFFYLHTFFDLQETN